MNEPWWKISGRRKQKKERWRKVDKEVDKIEIKIFFLKFERNIYMNETGRRCVWSRNIPKQRKYERIPMWETERRHTGRRKIGKNKCKKKPEWMKLDKNM